ncbi:hypothetical protein HALLA_01685 (plasmid) [Halostagnicola larsenii XH-48]|uniref:Uncharacterized protein n=1 Tax=Halostagnicola larsenii XH-48 TaxID=797299 RepID=W0JTX3_9EURY|nr:hypothetical protein HALLA_01685 [Halostagnicola larsenii XH-48]
MTSSRHNRLSYNWILKADLQLESGRSSDHVTIDETVIRLDSEQYWLYTAVDPVLNDLLYTTLEATRNKLLSSVLFRELLEKHDVDDSMFLVDVDKSQHDACQRYNLNCRNYRQEIGSSVKHLFEAIK